MDANSAGFVHGGTIMRYCDEAAGLAAVRHSQRRCVTAGMDRMTFNEPVHIGEVVSFKATVNAAWRTSLEVGVRVEAEDPRTGDVAPHDDRLPDDGRARRRRAPERGPGARVRDRRRAPPRARGAAAPRRTGSPSASRSCTTARSRSA